MTKNKILYNFLLNFIKSEFDEIHEYSSESSRRWVSYNGGMEVTVLTGGNVWAINGFCGEVRNYFPSSVSWDIEDAIKILLENKML